MKTITQQNNNHCPLCHAALPHQRGHYAGWLPWRTVEYWMILRVGAGRKKHLLPITGCQRWQVGKKSAHGQWPPSSAQPHSIAFGSWHHQYATSKPLGVRWRASGRVFVFALVCVCVFAPVCVCVCARAFACAWLITHLRPIGEPRPLTPLCALDEWGDKRTHLVMRSQIIHLAFDQEGLTGEKQGRMARRRREERRGGDKRNNSKRERERRKAAKGRKMADCKERGCVSERWREEKNENEGSWNAIVRSYQDGRAVLLPKALQWAAECLAHRRWPQQISAKIWITLGLNWPLNTQ